MELSSDLEARFCLVWTSERPRWNEDRYSSTFSLMDSDWRLYSKIVTHRRYSNKTFNVVILKRENEAKEALKNNFRVTTFVENSFDYSFPSLGFTKEVTSGSAMIWLYEQDEVAKKIPLLGIDGGKWRIVCLFHCAQWLMPQMKDESIHLSDETDLNLAFIEPDEEFVSDLEKLSHDFSNLFKDENFSDVKLRCGDRTVPAHRVVLAARSETFADLLRSRADETGVVDLMDLEAHVLDLLLMYLYSGKVPDLSEDTVLGLYAASDIHGLRTLKKTCSDWMISNMTKENSVRYLRVADAHSDDALKEALQLSKKPSEAVVETHERSFRTRRKKVSQ